MEFTLLWAAMTAVGGLWLGTRFWSGSHRRDDFDRLLGASIAGLVGGRLVAMIIQGLNPLTNLGDFMIVRGGVDTGAAATFAIATMLWTTRKEKVAVDRIAPAALLGLAGWHLGCLWRGACLGVASNVPWAWAESGSSITRHPVEIYAALALVAASILVARLPGIHWLASASALFAASVIRLGTEPLRLSLTGGPVVWYWAGSLVGLTGTIAALWRTDRSELSRTPTPGRLGK